MEAKIRWGIVGLGNIAHSFAKDLQLVPDGKLTAVGSRSLEKAKSFAKEYEAEHAFGSYQELFEYDGVDAVYIATPHTSHAELTILAANHGKHILCEKPMGIDRSQVEEMIIAAERNQVFLMEALWSRFNPSIQKVKKIIDDGLIGDVGYLHADFAFYGLDRDEKGRLLNPDLAGGSLLDIGIYPIFLAYLLLGKPKNIQATSHFYKTGVEVQTSMIFDYPNAQAVLYSGLTSDSEMKAEIAGSKGTIFLKPRWHNAQGYSIAKNGTTEKFDLPTNGLGYSHEIDEVHDCLRKGKLQSDLWSLQNSLELSALLDDIRELSGIVFPFEQ